MASTYAGLLMGAIGGGVLGAWLAASSRAANAVVVAFAGIAGVVFVTAGLRAGVVRPLARRRFAALVGEAERLGESLQSVRAAAQAADLIFVADLIARHGRSATGSDDDGALADGPATY